MLSVRALLSRVGVMPVSGSPDGCQRGDHWPARPGTAGLLKAVSRVIIGQPGPGQRAS